MEHIAEKRELAPDEIVRTLGLVNFVMEVAGKEDRHVFESFICMTMEEYCYQHDLNVVEEMQALTNIAKEINEKLGTYDPGREVFGC